MEQEKVASQQPSSAGAVIEYRIQQSDHDDDDDGDVSPLHPSNFHRHGAVEASPAEAE